MNRSVAGDCVARSWNEKILDICLALNMQFEIEVKITDSVFNLFKGFDVVITGTDGVGLKIFKKHSNFIVSKYEFIGINLIFELESCS